MAHPEDLIKFISERANEFDLRVLNLTWPERIGLKLWDVDISLKIEGRTYNGRGSDVTSDLAIIKAFVEGYERSLLSKLNLKTSNGLAGHTDRQLARRNALFEIYERHIFFEHFLTETPFKRHSDGVLSVESRLLVGELRNLGVQIAVGREVYPPIGSFAVVALDGRHFHKPYGVIVGTAFAETFEKALMRSLIEALRFHFFYSDKLEYTALSLQDFDSLDSATVDDHGRLGLNLEYGTWFFERFWSNSERPSVALPKVEVRDLPLGLGAPPLCFAHATSQLFNDLKIGERSISGQPHPFR